MKEAKGIITAVLFIGAAFALSVYQSQITSIIGSITHSILLWAFIIIAIAGILDAMQIINIFTFKPNKKLIGSVELKPSKARQPWE